MKKMFLILIAVMLLFTLVGCSSQSTNVESKDKQEERVISTANVEKNSKEIVGYWIAEIIPEGETEGETESNKDAFSGKAMFDENGKYMDIVEIGNSEYTYKVINDEQVQFNEGEHQWNVEYSFKDGKLLLYWLGTKESGKEPVIYKRITKEKFEQGMRSSVGSFNIALKARDVQYDMTNNLDKEFVISGLAELDDYYNYGFDRRIESKYFCVNVTPTGGSYSDRWYLYFHRESFKELFNELKQGKRNVTAVCTIPSGRYKEGQGNMAQVKRVEW